MNITMTSATEFDITEVIAAIGDVTDPTFDNLVEHGYKAIALGDDCKLYGGYNVGLAVWNEVHGEGGTMTHGQCVAKIDENPIAAQVGTSASSVSIYVKIVSAFDDYDTMVDELRVAGKPLSVRSAYAMACEKVGKAKTGRKAQSKTEKAQNAIHSALKPLTKSQRIAVLKAELAELEG